MANMTKEQGESLLQSLTEIQEAMRRRGDPADITQLELKIEELGRVVDTLRVVVLEGNGKPSVKAQLDTLNESVRGLSKQLNETKKGRGVVLVALITAIGSVLTALAPVVSNLLK